MSRKSVHEKSIPSNIKTALEAAIERVVGDKSKYVNDPKVDFTRKRKLDLETMIYLILSMHGNSLPKELYDYFKDSGDHVSTSAFVQQRSKILPELFEAIFTCFNALCADKKTYKGYHLYAVDGSDINIARNPDDETTYFEQGFNQIHLNAMFDLMNKTYADYVIQPARLEHEVRAAIEMATRYNFPEKSILIADRGYESVNLREYINRTPNLDYLIRVKNAGIKEIRELPLEELDIMQTIELRTTQTKEDKKAFANGEAKWVPGSSKFGKENKKVCWDFESPCKVTQRVVRIEISPGEYETILTSLPKETFPLSEIKKLYHMRWGIETSCKR